MKDSRRQQPGRSERSEPLDKSGEHTVQNSHQGTFPMQNTMPMQPSVYQYMNPHQQHMPNMAHIQSPFPLGPQVGDGLYNGVPLSGGGNGSMGPSPAPGAAPYLKGVVNPLVRSAHGHSPQQGSTPGIVPASQYESVDQNPFMPSYYPRIVPNQTYQTYEGNGKPYNVGSLTPGSKARTPADSRNNAGSGGYPGQHSGDQYNQMYRDTSHESPHPSNFSTNDENVDKQKAIYEEMTQRSGKRPPMPNQNPMVAALRFQYLRKSQSDQALLRLHEFVDAINLSAPNMTDIDFWKKMTHDMFTPRASIRYTKKVGTDYRFFEISATMLPMMYVSLNTLDVQRIEVTMSQLKAEFLSNENVFFHTPALTFSYYYSDGSYITHHSQLKGSFNTTFKIEWLDVLVYKFSPGIDWNSLERVLSRPGSGFNTSQQVVSGPGTDQSLHMSGSDSPKDPQRDIGNGIKRLRSSICAFKSISGQGLHDGILRIFQVSDVMSALTELCVHQREHKIKSPLEALTSFVKKNRDGSMSYTPMKEQTNGGNSSNNGGAAKGKNGPGKDDQTNVSNNSPACSPRDMKGIKPVASESGPQLKRRRSNKAVSRASRGSSSSTPTSESFDCNGIPGTKKIKF